MNAHIITYWGILSDQVCSLGTEEEALNWLRVEMPSGTQLNWVKDERPEARPVQCADDATRTHYLFTC